VSVQAVVPAPLTSAPALTVEAMRAAQVMMRKSPETQRTYRGIWGRFAGWLADRDGVAEAGVDAYTSQALIEYLEQLEERCSPSTVKKERAALRKLARYLHQLQLLDATVILMIEIPTVSDHALARHGLDRESWKRVLTVARARLTPTAQERCSRQVAARDLALIQTLGGAGLRSQEARTLPTDPFDQGRSDNRGGGVYLRVRGKGRKVRAVPLFTTWSTHSSCGASSATGSRNWPTTLAVSAAGAPAPRRFVPQRRRPTVNDGCDPNRPAEHARRRRARQAGPPAHPPTHFRQAVHVRPRRRALPAATHHGTRLAGDNEPLRLPRRRRAGRRASAHRTTAGRSACPSPEPSADTGGGPRRQPDELRLAVVSPRSR